MARGTRFRRRCASKSREEKRPFLSGLPDAANAANRLAATGEPTSAASLSCALVTWRGGAFTARSGVDIAITSGDKPVLTGAKAATAPVICFFFMCCEVELNLVQEATKCVQFCTTVSFKQRATTKQPLNPRKTKTKQSTLPSSLWTSGQLTCTRRQSELNARVVVPQTISADAAMKIAFLY